MGREKQDFFDQLLEASIRQHAAAEPRVGLEGRILAGVAARRQSAQRRTWVWGLAFSTIVVVAVITALRFSRHSSPLASRHPSIAILHPQTETPAPSVAPDPIPMRAVRVRRTPPPRPQQYPSPAALSVQEKLLLRYVEMAPKSALMKPVVPSTSEPMEIPKIAIAALHIKSLPGTHD